MIAANRLIHLGYKDLSCAQIDHHRSQRKGFPEVICGEGKTAPQIVTILERMIDQETVVLVTGISPDQAERVMKAVPDCDYDNEARIIRWGQPSTSTEVRGTILVVSAGTSEMPLSHVRP